MYRILVADDEAIIREGIKCLFDYEKLGFTIVGEAANGEDAYNEIMRLTPDVVLLDIRMPGMSGLEVVRAAREQGFQGKVIIISSYSDFTYAQEAIRYGVLNYVTKPIDEDELEKILTDIKADFDKEKIKVSTSKHYRHKAHDSIVKDLLLGDADLETIDREDLHLNTDVFQVAIYEKFRQQEEDTAYEFTDLLRVANPDNHSFDHITLQNAEVLLLKGDFAVRKFYDFLDRYQRENRPQKNSPLDTFFITYGRPVSGLSEVPLSYEDAQRLLSRRFFCEQEQHTIGYQALPSFTNTTALISDALLSEYVSTITNYLQAYNRSKMAATLKELQEKLYNASDSIDAIKLFLTDLHLQVKEHMNRLYPNNTIPFPRNSEIIQTTDSKYFLYEIIQYMAEQFEMIMAHTCSSTRDSVLDDILQYINHNYTSNITLENIAPLFGYNSSYLGKIFSKKMGENFNSYVDHIRIEKSKELLQNEALKVYQVAEQIGYRNVDYFHIKFKKYVGQSPAEYRKKIRGRA